MIRAGLRGEVLSSYTTWLCASCYACTVACPKQIRVTDIMYAAKRLAIREGIHPRRFPTPVLAQAFFKEIEACGRSTESHLLMQVLLRARPLKIFKQARLGWNLLRTGRMAVQRDPIARRDELRRMLKALEKDYMVGGNIGGKSQAPAAPEVEFPLTICCCPGIASWRVTWSVPGSSGPGASPGSWISVPRPPTRKSTIWTRSRGPTSRNSPASVSAPSKNSIC
jgi:hypothetical protein